eukprot:m.10808 g.10808  ORF g.10808 m.10808 type:complete len:481 (-) comp2780_c0_seq1:144-1586(-)
MAASDRRARESPSVHSTTSWHDLSLSAADQTRTRPTALETTQHAHGRVLSQPTSHRPGVPTAASHRFVDSRAGMPSRCPHTLRGRPRHPYTHIHNEGQGRAEAGPARLYGVPMEACRLTPTSWVPTSCPANLHDMCVSPVVMMGSRGAASGQHSSTLHASTTNTVVSGVLSPSANEHTFAPSHTTPWASRGPLAAHTRARRKEKEEQETSTAMLCGLASGIIQAGLFNPIDRALFLTVHHRRPFLTWANFASPYQGFLQSVWVRAISGGLYYPLEDVFVQRLERFDSSSPAIPYVAGSLAGVFSSGILNPLQAVKYRTWFKNDPRAAWHEAARMWANGGWAPFMRGLWPRLMRDIVFGATYTSLRFRWGEQVPEHLELLTNTLAAGTATVLSGPLNYAQNIQYGTSSKAEQPGTYRILRDLVRETRAQTTPTGKLSLLTSRLRIGWGTVRVAFGMAFGNLLYDGFLDAASLRKSRQADPD